MEKLISIIMPAYNAAKYIGEAIDSVIGQTYKEWELLVIDDGSTDNTKEIVNAYKTNDDRIKYFYQQNAKQGKARNYGLQLSKGLLIAFLDSDDLWLPSKLEESLIEFDSQNQDVLFTNAYFYQNSFSWDRLETLGKFAVHTKTYSGKDGLGYLLFENRIPMLTVLAKKEAVIAVGGFRDRGKAEDYELWLNLLANDYVLRGIDKPLGLYRLHEESTSSVDKKMSNEVLWMLTDFFAENSGLKKDFCRQKIHWLITVIHNKNSVEDVLTLFSDSRLKQLGLKLDYKTIAFLSKLTNFATWKKLIYYTLVLRNIYIKI